MSEFGEQFQRALDQVVAALAASRISSRQAAKTFRVLRRLTRRHYALEPMPRRHPRHHPPLSAQARKSIRANRAKRLRKMRS